MPVRYTCPCCGYKTLTSFPGGYELCEICYWEDDGVQVRDPSFEGGANQPSLIQARINFERFGANRECERDKVREPGAKDRRDPKWRKATAADIPVEGKRPEDDYSPDQLEYWCYWLR
jgi:hypothetical protein